MIAKVVRGWRPAGLIAYLFGPGKFEEHRNPRIVASWDGALWLHQPDKLASVVLGGEVVQPGEFDLDLRPLTATMQDPARLAGLPLTAPPPLPEEWIRHLRNGDPLPASAPDWARHYRYDRDAQAVIRRLGYVWHCPVRLHPDDPTLSDGQWQEIAERLMRAVGIHQASCRWIAVRHADDHIHLLAVLVSETTGRRFHPFRDYLKLRAECQAIERDLGLTPTASADRTAAPAPTRAEIGKAQRLGRAVTAREELRMRVAQCAAMTSSGPEFLEALQREGLDPRAVRDETGEVRGYSVAHAGHRTAGGQPVRFSGRRLAPDLTWPHLMNRWSGLSPIPTTKDRPTPADRRTALHDATTAVHRAADSVRGNSNADAVAYAAGEFLTAVSRAADGYDPGPLSQAMMRFGRASRIPYTVIPTKWGAAACELRRASRQIAAVGALSGRGHEKLAMTALVLALAGLIAEIAAWQQQQGRHHQAIAARRTIGDLPAATPLSPSPWPFRSPSRSLFPLPSPSRSLFPSPSSSFHHQPALDSTESHRRPPVAVPPQTPRPRRSGR